MPYEPIRYRNGELFFENAPVTRAARRFGTPLYMYSRRAILENYRAYRMAFARTPRLVAYALKANSNSAILKILAREGAGADIVSGGELTAALRAGFPPGRIIFTGVGKSQQEIRFALRTGILMLNVESAQEMHAVDRIARQLRMRARIALRVNPDIDPKTHPHITTGMAHNKFGIGIDEAFRLYRQAKTMRGLAPVGMHSHIGSQILDVSSYRLTVSRQLQLFRKLAAVGIRLRYLDCGGGLGIRYRPEEKQPLPRALAGAVIPLLRGTGLTLIVEPGRSIVGNAGILVTRVLYIKKSPRKKFVVVDAGMTDLVRPALYDAYHEILPVAANSRTTAGRLAAADVVGPICESADMFAKDRKMRMPQQGDCVIIAGAGAYGYSMASNYNMRLRAAEVLVDDGEMRLIRRRETYSDLFRLDC